MMRCFIAVELPDALKQEVAEIQAEFKQTGADVKWVESASLHLTIKFLGDIGEDKISALKESLPFTLHPSSFTITLEGIGAFPKTIFPRVIWVGVGEGKESLVNLARYVEEICSRLGFAPEERPFSAHLTIGRVRSRQGLAPLIKKLQVAEFRGSVPAPVSQLTLFQSTLSPKGPTYTPLAEIPLG